MYFEIDRETFTAKDIISPISFMVELTAVLLYFHLEQLAGTSDFYSMSVVTLTMLPSSSKEFLLSRVFFLSSPSHIHPLCSLEYCIII